MNINRYNYEEYFLLYVDNELSAAEREAVEVFVQANPDLRDELTILEESVLRPDRKMVFDDKASLIRSVADANPVNESNYEEYFVLYGDNELTNEEKDWVEQFIYKHPQFEAEFELIQKARMDVDSTVVFIDKSSLYRKEEEERPVIVMRWWKIAVAAAIVLMIGGAAIYFAANTGGTNPANPGELAGKTNDAGKKEDTGRKITPTIDGETSNPDQIAVTGKDLVNPSQNSNKNILSNKIKGEEATELKKQSLRDTAFQAYYSPKKSENSSNSSHPPIVIPKDPVQENTTLIASNDTKPIAIDIEKDFAKMDENDPGNKRREARADEARFASNTDENIEVLNTTVSNKGKMRGFFRKLGRAVDKATHLGNTAQGDTDDTDKKGVRVASFQIALK